MSRTLWLLFLAAVINGALGKRGMRIKAPRDEAPGVGFGQGRYARGSGGGSFVFNKQITNYTYKYHSLISITHYFSFY